MAENILLRFENRKTKIPNQPQLKPQNVKQILLSFSMGFSFKKRKKSFNIVQVFSPPTSPKHQEEWKKTNAIEG